MKTGKEKDERVFLFFRLREKFETDRGFHGKKRTQWKRIKNNRDRNNADRSQLRICPYLPLLILPRLV